MSTLESGSRLGPYEILELLGRGGMGEVYRAHDSRLERDVAIKVLPERFSNDAEFGRRFEREARTISQLQHAHVCTLYDIGSDGDRSYLVMELLDGETLEERLKRGPLALDDVVTIGVQIAEAIEAAHRRNVVHRDLKPGNVMLTPSGAKVLDFGLAKGLVRKPAAADTQTPTAPQISSQEPLTSEGSILGTLHYMAPEQLEGNDADVRSDIFALGAVLYQMATGKRPFQGDSQALLIASIMTARPEALEPRGSSLPARLGKVIDRCLAKSPERRWQSARDVALELEETGKRDEATAVDPNSEHSSTFGRTLVVSTLSALVLGLVAGALLFRTLSTSSDDASRSGVSSGIWTVSSLDLGHDPRYLRLSPDGRRLASTDQQGRLHLRELDSTSTVPFEEPNLPVVLDFSPDGESLFFGSRESGVRELTLESGIVSEPLAEGLHGFRGRDGFFYWFNPDDPRSLYSVRLWRRPADAGDVSSEVRDLGPGFAFAGTVTEDGSTLFVSQFAEADPLSIDRLDVESGERQSVGLGSQPFLLPPGYLVFFRDNSLLAARVDPDTAEILGSPKVVESGIADTPNARDSGVFALSRTGDLVYRSDIGRDQARLVWTNQAGDDLGDAAPDVGSFAYPEISPDGRFAKIGLREVDGTSVHRRLDFESGAWSQVARAGRRNGTLRWAGPSGEEHIFASDMGTGGPLNVFIGPADGSRPAVRMVSSPTTQVPLDVSPDGRRVLYHGFVERGFLSFDRDTEESTRIEATGWVDSASFHPDGGWIAYAVDSTTDGGIWVRPTRRSGQALRLTEGRDLEVRWSTRGDEILYRGESHLMSIPVRVTDDSLETGRPVELFEDFFLRSPFRGITNWAVHPDGRFLFLESVEEQGGGKVVYVQNWVAKVESVFAQLGEENLD